MKNVLCYGDSNTWGYIPGKGGERYDWKTRWTGRLQNLLGDDFHVTEEGLNSRTTVFDDPVKGYKSGLAYLPPCLTSHKPLDLVIVMLGTNDLHERFGMNAYNVGEAMKRLMEEILHSDCGVDGKAPAVLLVSPVHILETVMDNFIGEEMGESCVEKSGELSQQLSRIADLEGVSFFDAESVVCADPVDGVHMNSDSHAVLAVALSEEVKKLLESGSM